MSGTMQRVPGQAQGPQRGSANQASDDDTRRTLQPAPGQARPPQKKSANQTDEEPLTPELVDLAVAELRYQTAFHLEAVQAMMDGVTLGAEQVQDKQIELLQVGPTVTTEDSILAFVMTLVLEGTVGPAIASIATRAVVAPLMRATSRAILRMQNVPATWKKINRLYNDAFELSEKSIKRGLQLSGKQRGDMIWQARELQRQANTLQNDLRGKLGGSKGVRDALNNITVVTEGNLIAVVKAGKEVKDLQDKDGKPSDAQTSPGVDVVAAAMKSASRLRLTVVATHEALEVEIKRSGIKMGEVIEILNDYRVDNIVDLGQIRESFQLASEAMIWSKLLLNSYVKKLALERQDQANENRKVTGDADISGVVSFPKTPGGKRLLDGPFLTLGDIDDKLREYLIARFSREIDRWVAEGKKEIPIRAFFNASPTDTEKQIIREDFLIQYLIEIERGSRDFKLRG